MKITIDLAQSPVALLNEMTQAVRLALGANFYIEESDSPNFSDAELAYPAVNLAALPAVATVSGASTPNTSGVAALPAASPTNGVEVDTEGHPYDVRIHSAGKSKIANGTWKLKKGVDKDLVVQINAQNKTLMATPLPGTPPAVTITAVTPGAATESPLVATLPPLVTMPVLAALPPVAQVAAADVEIEVTDYATFAQFVAQQMVAKPVATERELNVGLTHYGFVDAAGAPDMTVLAHRPDAVMPLYTWLKATIGLCAA